VHKLLKKLAKSKNGTILVYVLFLFASIMIIIASLLAFTYQHYNGVVIQQLNARAYYLALETTDVVSAALLYKPSGGISMLEEFYDEFISKGTQGFVDTIVYQDGDEYLGESKIKLVFERDDRLSTSEKDEYWATIYIKTSVPDYRVNYKKETVSNPKYELYYVFKIFVSDPNKRVFDIITEDKTV